MRQVLLMVILTALATATTISTFADAHSHMQGAPADFSDRAIAAGVFYVMNPTLLASIAPAPKSDAACFRVSLCAQDSSRELHEMR
jgi:hypothetical protein